MVSHGRLGHRTQVYVPREHPLERLRSIRERLLSLLIIEVSEQEHRVRCVVTSWVAHQEVLETRNGGIPEGDFLRSQGVYRATIAIVECLSLFTLPTLDDASCFLVELTHPIREPLHGPLEGHDLYLLLFRSRFVGSSTFRLSCFHFSRCGIHTLSFRIGPGGRRERQHDHEWRHAHHFAPPPWPIRWRIVWNRSSSSRLRSPRSSPSRSISSETWAFRVQ